MTETKPILPRAVGEWTGPDTPKVVTAENIFDYMDGAGELYLGYRFDHCDVYEYHSPAQKEILVELYFMQSPDDAFGLLSLDWGGEAIGSSPADSREAVPGGSHWPRALYGEGLLRLWSGNIYARVMATQETPESREAVLSIGRAIAKDRKDLPRPQLWENLPESLLSDWALRRDKASYFRTHLVLNSLYYLSHQNILDLDLACEAAMAPYERESSSGSGSRIQFLSVKYPDPEQALAALAHFHRDYLPEHSFVSEQGVPGETGGVFPVEDGWLAYKVRGRSAFFAFECPDEKTARATMDGLH